LHDIADISYYANVTIGEGTFPMIVDTGRSVPNVLCAPTIVDITQVLIYGSLIPYFWPTLLERTVRLTTLEVQLMVRQICAPVCSLQFPPRAN
jgi:hypothetical protein